MCVRRKWKTQTVIKSFNSRTFEVQKRNMEKDGVVFRRPGLCSFLVFFLLPFVVKSYTHNSRRITIAQLDSKLEIWECNMKTCYISRDAHKRFRSKTRLTLVCWPWNSQRKQNHTKFFEIRKPRSFYELHWNLLCFMRTCGIRHISQHRW